MTWDDLLMMASVTLLFVTVWIQEFRRFRERGEDDA